MGQLLPINVQLNLYVIQGAPSIAQYSGTVPLQRQRVSRDWRLPQGNEGFIRDRAMIKTSPTAPEVPMPLARIWVQRLVDGFKAWEGFSDSLGYYNATGLEVGVTYVVTAIDLTGEHKCTAGGPVVAVKA